MPSHKACAMLCVGSFGLFFFYFLTVLNIEISSKVYHHGFLRIDSLLENLKNIVKSFTERCFFLTFYRDLVIDVGASHDKLNMNGEPKGSFLLPTISPAGVGLSHL